MARKPRNTKQVEFFQDDIEYDIKIVISNSWNRSLAELKKTLVWLTKTVEYVEAEKIKKAVEKKVKKKG